MSRTSLRTGVLALAVFAALLFTFKMLSSTSTLQAAPGFESTIRAPEFPANADWLNTDKPLSLRGLKGKIVLLDFWTYCCINCIQTLPDLKKLERKYANELVVIGVHSAKFDNEGETQNIKNAIMRYKIEHPVLNDKDMKVWDEYAVRAWPTLVLVGPGGRIALQLSGEGHYETLDTVISQLIKDFKERGELKTEPMKLALEAAKVQKTDLSFPGKVLAFGDKLFVADSNHNRIIVSDFNGNVQSVAGSGVQGLKDGDFGQANFHNPQGMALSEDGSTLYVADTDNHAIRALDLKNKKVETISGNGRKAQWRNWGGVGTKAALASPWDVLRVGNTLYVAMAGTHQVWAMDLNTKKIAPYAGSGAEARFDAELIQSALAQPSGLASDGNKLYFADSESSSIRSIDLPNNRDQLPLQVKTHVGGDPNPRNLFAFGDQDGAGFEAKLQHPLGVAFDGGKVFVADTYNHKIKVLDPAKSSVQTLWGSREELSEPSGLSIANNKLFIADTNNHRIRVLDLQSKAATTVAFKNLSSPLPAEPERTQPQSDKDGALVLAPQTLAPGKGELVFDVKLPEGFKLNKEAPQKFSARVEGAELALAKTQIKNKEFALPLRVAFTGSEAEQSGVLHVAATINYCKADNSICKIKTLSLRAPFAIRDGGENQLTISAQISTDNSASTLTTSNHGGKTKMAKIMKTEDEWKQELTPTQYNVLRQKGTERAFSGELNGNKKEGTYKCAGCGTELFDSQTKFDSGTGWPSFYKPVSDENIAEESDVSYGMRRVEVLCARCDGHLGHVFEDGPKPTGLRYCINSAALKFEEKK